MQNKDSFNLCIKMIFLCKNMLPYDHNSAMASLHNSGHMCWSLFLVTTEQCSDAVIPMHLSTNFYSFFSLRLRLSLFVQFRHRSATNLGPILVAIHPNEHVLHMYSTGRVWTGKAGTRPGSPPSNSLPNWLSRAVPVCCCWLVKV